MYPMTPKKAVTAGPTLLRTVPPKQAEKNHTVQRSELTTWTVCALLGLAGVSGFQGVGTGTGVDARADGLPPSTSAEQVQCDVETCCEADEDTDDDTARYKVSMSPLSRHEHGQAATHFCQKGECSLSSGIPQILMCLFAV